jgi:uncharacterized membrane protein
VQSAFGTKRRSQQCFAMSAFGGKADINGRYPMSAFDPKQTSAIGIGAVESLI